MLFWQLFTAVLFGLFEFLRSDNATVMLQNRYEVNMLSVLMSR